MFLSIQYAQKNYREDIKNRVLPYIAVTHYKSKSKINLFELIQNEPVTEEKNYYKEYKVGRIFFVINDENIEVKESLTQQQDNLLKKGGFSWKQTAEGFALVNASFISCPIEIENVGNGAAINFRVGFNRVNQKRLYVTPLQLKQNETLYIHIFSDSVTNNTLGDYELEFFYEDIYGTKYTQKYKLSVAKEKETGRTYNSIDFSGRQIEYKEEQTNG